MNIGRQYQGGKVVVIVLILINIALLAAVSWLLNQPGLGDLKPATGETAYLMAVNGEGEPVIYSKNGSRWPTCGPNQCSDTPSSLDIEFPYSKGFVVVEFNSDEDTKYQASESALISELLVPTAFANVGDGKCPITAIEVKGSRLIKHYPTSEEDPDCPPR